MSAPHSVAAHWAGSFDEAGLQKWAEDLYSQLGGTPPSLGLVFMTPRFFANAQQVLEILRVHARIPVLAGCSSQGLIVGDKEIEENAGLALGLFVLPSAELKPFHFTQAQVDEANGAGYWPMETGVESDKSN